jgi:hypothetical protein
MGEGFARHPRSRCFGITLVRKELLGASLQESEPLGLGCWFPIASVLGTE